VARAEADGQTLLMGHIGTLAVNPSIYPRLAYDPMNSFTAVAWVARVPNALVVNAQSPTWTLTEFVERAKSMPGQLPYSSGGNGNTAHITFEYQTMASSPLLASQPRRWRGSTPKSTRRSPCPR
jgi:tripartite-type tricarboxylate transporter receptor subunit TctC